MKSTFLKVMAILCLIFGIIGVIVSAMTALTAGGLAMLGISFPMVSVILSIIGAILMIVAGAIGLGASKDPAKAGKAMTWGIILIVINVIALIVGIVESQSLLAQFNEIANAFGAESLNVSTVSWNNFTGLIIPILYFVAALLFKKKAAK